MMCYQFPTEAACKAKLAEVATILGGIAAQHGFTVVPGVGVLGKRLTTGEDIPEAMTTAWADPRELADHTWGFVSLRRQFDESYPAIEAAAGLPPPQERALYYPPQV